MNNVAIVCFNIQCTRFIRPCIATNWKSTKYCIYNKVIASVCKKKTLSVHLQMFKSVYGYSTVDNGHRSCMPWDVFVYYWLIYITAVLNAKCMVAFRQDSLPQSTVPSILTIACD